MSSGTEWNVNSISGHKCVDGKFFFQIKWEDSHLTREEITKWKETKPKHIRCAKKLSNNIFVVQWNSTWEKREYINAELVENYLSKVRRSVLFRLCEQDYYQRQTQSAFASALWN